MEEPKNTSDILLILFSIFACLLVLLVIFSDKEMKQFAAIPVSLLSISIIIAIYSLFKKVL